VRIWRSGAREDHSWLQDVLVGVILWLEWLGAYESPANFGSLRLVLAYRSRREDEVKGFVLKVSLGSWEK
jgi:hypothetical protein